MATDSATDDITDVTDELKLGLTDKASATFRIFTAAVILFSQFADQFFQFGCSFHSWLE